MYASPRMCQLRVQVFLHSHTYWCFPCVHVRSDVSHDMASTSTSSKAGGVDVRTGECWMRVVGMPSVSSFHLFADIPSASGIWVRVRLQAKHVDVTRPDMLCPDMRFLPCESQRMCFCNEDSNA